MASVSPGLAHPQGLVAGKVGTCEPNTRHLSSGGGKASLVEFARVEQAGL